MSENKKEKNETGIRHRFKQFIDEQGMSQKALAKEMDVTPSYTLPPMKTPLTHWKQWVQGSHLNQ